MHKNVQTNIYKILRKAIYAGSETCFVKHFVKDQNIIFQHSREDLYEFNENTNENQCKIKM